MRARTSRVLLPLALLAAVSASAQDTTRRGPLPARDEFLLAQPRLTLPAAAPDPLPRRETEVRLDGDWGSDFGWNGHVDVAGRPTYLVDGEHRSLSLTVRHGLGAGVTLGLRVPMLWRGPGKLDGLIDWWHRTLHFPDGGRSRFPDDRLRVIGRDREGPISWTGGEGTGLGNVELEAHDLVTGRDDARRWRIAFALRAALPTASGTYSGAGGGLGLQALAAHPIGSRVDAYLGAGVAVDTADRFEGIDYERVRPQGFLALEARVTRGWSAIAQLDAASGLVTNLDGYPGGTLYLRLGSKFGLGRAWMLEAGFTEGLIHQAAATDFGVMAALARKF